MAEILCTALAVLLFAAVIAAHEYAHASEMIRAGLDVAEVTIGFGPALISRTLANGTRLSLRLLPLGGYTKPRRAEQYDRLTNRAKTRIDGAGVWMNLAVGLMGLGIASAMNGHTWQLTAATAVPGVLVFAMRRRLVRLTLALAPITAVALVIPFLQMSQSPAGAPSLKHSGSPVAGPLSLFELLVARYPGDSVAIAAVVSLSMAMMNALPLLAMDGGRIAWRWVARHRGPRTRRAFEYASLSVFALLMLGGLASDVITKVLT